MGYAERDPRFWLAAQRLTQRGHRTELGLLHEVNKRLGVKAQADWRNSLPEKHEEAGA